MQALYVSLAHNQLQGTVPGGLPKLTVLDMSFNSLTNATLDSLPAKLQLVYLANSFVAGTLPASGLPPNLSLLDISYNSLSGSLPEQLPSSLSVLNISHNSFSDQMPANWSKLQLMTELHVDNNPLTGKLPASWSAWGNTSGNSLQLSITNTSLHGHMPSQWVQQFCLATFSSSQVSNPRLLFKPVLIILSGQLDAVATFQKQPAGPTIELPAKQASINVTLDGKAYSFDYNNPASICSIPDAVRNVALVWGIFAVLMLALVAGVIVWSRRRSRHSIGALSKFQKKVLDKLSVVTTHVSPGHRSIITWLAERAWYLAFDVVWNIYSQVSDAITIHQVFGSGQLSYAYALLAILLLPYGFMYLLVVRTSVICCQSKIGNQAWHHASACLIGVVVSPVVFVMFLVAMPLNGVGIPLSTSLQFFGVDIFSFYRMQSFAETFLNALPQSILQSKLYLMGNDPGGVHVYIDTTLFLYSITGSMLSILKTVPIVLTEPREHSYMFVYYWMKLLKLESL